MPKRFLISRLSSLGDVVCSLPAAAALKAEHPDSVIEWVVDPRFADIVRACTSVDTVHAIKPSFSPQSWPSFEHEFDAAFDLQGLSKSAIAVWRAQAKSKLGYHWQREGSWLFSSQVLPDPSSIHIVDQYVDVVRAYGVSSHRAAFRLSPTAESLTSVRTKLPDSQNFVVINPGAAWITKRWPAESFAAVIDRLAVHKVQSVLIGGKAQTDLDVADSVLSHCQSQPVNLCGQTSIAELIALLSLSKGHLGGDTGSTHIAAALGIPAIGLYSITNPARSCPYGQFSRCLYHPESLAKITADEVSAKLEEALL